MGFHFGFYIIQKLEDYFMKLKNHLLVLLLMIAAIFTTGSILSPVGTKKSSALKIGPF